MRLSKAQANYEQFGAVREDLADKTRQLGFRGPASPPAFSLALN
jgi:hypothetical protein